MEFNPNYHRRRSIRLKGYDYSMEGLYFVTLCTHKKVCIFGEITKNQMVLNDAGKIANDYWLEIPVHFPNAILHEHIIMPNHVHGIVELTTVNAGSATPFGAQRIDLTVGAKNVLPQQQPQRRQNEFQKMIPGSIGAIIKGYKIGVTKWLRQNQADDFPSGQPVWQRNYYEHIIRNEKAFYSISDYIMNNPANWNDDRLFSL